MWLRDSCRKSVVKIRVLMLTRSIRSILIHRHVGYNLFLNKLSIWPSFLSHFNFFYVRLSVDHLSFLILLITLSIRLLLYVCWLGIDLRLTRFSCLIIIVMLLIACLLLMICLLLIIEKVLLWSCF